MSMADAELLRAMRRCAGMTMTEAASYAGVSQAQWSRWEATGKGIGTAFGAVAIGTEAEILAALRRRQETLIARLAGCEAAIRSVGGEP